jgi:hypothetical protein
MPTAKKLGRNDTCSCESGKKYKNCCLIVGQPKKQQPYIIPFERVTDDKVKYCMESINETIGKHNSIIMLDVTECLTNDDHYRSIQLQFMKNKKEKTVLFAKKTKQNEIVFNSRVESAASDMMILYCGHYRTFAFRNFSNVLNSCCTLICGQP